MAVYIEEQIQALAKMCEALIVQVHWGDDQLRALGHPAEGHIAYPASGCKAKVCEAYAEAYRQLHFGERSFHMAEMRGENERLLGVIDELETKIAGLTGMVCPTCGRPLRNLDDNQVICDNCEYVGMKAHA